MKKIIVKQGRFCTSKKCYEKTEIFNMTDAEFERTSIQCLFNDGVLEVFETTKVKKPTRSNKTKKVVDPVILEETEVPVEVSEETELLSLTSEERKTLLKDAGIEEIPETAEEQTQLILQKKSKQYSKTYIKDKDAKWQTNKLKELGCEEIPRLEDERVNLIYELQR